LLNFLEELDAFRQRTRFDDFLLACECDSRGRLGLENCPLDDAEHLRKALQAALSVDAGGIAKHYATPTEIKQAVADARTQAIEAMLALSRKPVL
jgi:tRNA nucleotidyltransferase (CCA-adding enzyme)